jgi:D-amino acid dehydrogenase small subunit (EC 1.4.99.1)
MSKEVVVIGGGIIGLCAAYYLQREGHKVTVIDKSNMDAGASYANAGYLSPSHIVPLSAPGVMRKGLRWMLNSSSPLYIKPRFNSELLEWARAFNRSCNANHVTKAIPAIKNISLLSQDLYDDIKATNGLLFTMKRRDC